MQINWLYVGLGAFVVYGCVFGFHVRKRQWTKVADAGPVPRNHTKLVYDPVREVIVLFGGHDGDRVFGDTWEWDGTQWIARGGDPPRLRIDNGH